MKITVYTVTPNDDWETPSARVFASEDQCLEFVFDRLEIDQQDRDELRKLYYADEDLFRDALGEFQFREYDSYSIEAHCVELTAEEVRE